MKGTFEILQAPRQEERKKLDCLRAQASSVPEELRKAEAQKRYGQEGKGKVSNKGASSARPAEGPSLRHLRTEGRLVWQLLQAVWR